MKRRVAIVSGQRVEITWDEQSNRVVATVNGRAYDLEKRQLGPGEYWLGGNGFSIETLVRERDQQFEVSVKNQRIAVEFIDSSRRMRRAGASTDGIAEVRAPMPGKIVKILSPEGSEVEIHQGIVVMEAMKMQNEIRAPKQGKILQLSVAEGEPVALGDLIARVE
jgi:biotin carboxyl carrier protein